MAQDILEILMERFQGVNSLYIRKIAKQIATIGKLSQSSINRLVIMAEMNEDIAAINAELARAVQLATNDLYRLYEQALNNTYTDPRFARALKESPMSDLAKKRLEHYTQTVSRQTAGRMYNLSNTTIVSDVYRRAVDRAILAVSSGLEDYKSATRETVRELGYNGLQVMYPSGYHRRLDTAIRQNILDGTNQIAQNSSIMMGEELGYDAFELSAHMRSAPDHEPIQGRVFLKEEFEKLQSDQPFKDVDGNSYGAIRRPIGEWNCMHIAMSFSTKYSIRKYTDAQLKQWAEENDKGCEIDGKHYTTYAASQYMRKLETEIRKQKDVANAAKEAGDDVLRRECQERINALSQKYTEVSKAAGITPRRDRMRVNGFKQVKIPEKDSKESVESPSDKKPKQGDVQTPDLKVTRESSLNTGDPGKDLTVNISNGKINLTEELPPKASLSNEEVRKWYINHDKNIPNLIDQTAPIEEQARQACELRNYFRTTARDLMLDQETRKQLDVSRPNKSFDELLEDKMLRKGLTREEAALDILKTSTKTNKEVNRKLGLEE